MDVQLRHQLVRQAIAVERQRIIDAHAHVVVGLVEIARKLDSLDRDGYGTQVRRDGTARAASRALSNSSSRSRYATLEPARVVVASAHAAPL
jgi:hypothetical protein